MIQAKPNQQEDLPSTPHLLTASQLLQTYKPSQFGIKNHYNKEDPRVRYFDPEWIHNKKVIDIGCGEGNLALQLAIRYFSESMLGLDISEVMIKYANNTLGKCREQQQNKHNKKYSDLPINYKKLTNNIATIYPRREQLLGLLYSLPDSIIYQAQTLNEKRNSKQIEYTLKDIDLDLSLTHNKQTLQEFPNNIHYLHLNFFLLEEIQPNMFDTALCMSVAKSIHLTFGDEVLKLFFKKIHRHLRPHGMLIFQIQDYKSYKSDTRNNPINKVNFERMALKPKQYVDYLEEIGFKLLKRINHKQIPSLKKSILILYKL